MATQLVVDDRPVCPARTAGNVFTRTAGLMFRRDLDGGLLIRPCNSVHTMCMRFAIDVAFLDADGVVLETLTMRPWKVGKPRRASRAVLECAAGDFDRYGIVAGTRISTVEALVP